MAQPHSNGFPSLTSIQQRHRVMKNNKIRGRTLPHKFWQPFFGENKSSIVSSQTSILFSLVQNKC
ncbi:hypothetical protein HKD37_07G018989 [Glycine soja]